MKTSELIRDLATMISCYGDIDVLADGEPPAYIYITEEEEHRIAGGEDYIDLVPYLCITTEKKEGRK